MSKCNACGYFHPQPGDKSCRFYKEVREKAKKAGQEQAWAGYLDTDTLEGLQETELKGMDVKPPSSEGEEKARMQNQLDSLASKMDNLTSQFRALLSPPVPLQQSQSPFSVPGSMVTPPTHAQHSSWEAHLSRWEPQACQVLGRDCRWPLWWFTGHLSHRFRQFHLCLWYQQGLHYLHLNLDYI